MDNDDNYQKANGSIVSPSRPLEKSGSDSKKSMGSLYPEHNHNSREKDLQTYKKAIKQLKLASLCTFFFIIAQCIGGYLANSIAIFTDTAHLAADMMGFAMSMMALNMSIKPTSKEYTFGWHRAEIIGTLSSIIFLLVLTIGLVFAAVSRVYDPQQVKGKEMAFTAVMGLFFNLIQMRILGGDGEHGHGHSHDLGGGHSHSHGGDDSSDDGQIDGKNVNVQAAYLHVLGDMLMSVGVCIAALVIYFYPNAQIADPICTFVFSIIVCTTATPTIKRCISVLMEGSPPDIDCEQLLTDLIKIAPPGDKIWVHDFHLWSVSVGKPAMSIHLGTMNPNFVLKEATMLCRDKYKIEHLTIQVEDMSQDNIYKFKCEEDESKNTYRTEERYVKTLVKEQDGQVVGFDINP